MSHLQAQYGGVLPGGQGSSHTVVSAGGSGTGGAGSMHVVSGTSGGNGSGGAGGGGGNAAPWTPVVAGGGGLARPWPSRRPGLDGFDEAEFVAGSVTGYRWWSLEAPDLALSPARADIMWRHGQLRGMQDYWQPGLNIAICKSDRTYRYHPDSTIPDENCGCGYWAYWTLQHHQVGSGGTLPVCGVIEGSGNVLIGTKGFRCSRARIVALHLPFSIQPQVPASLERQLRAAGWDGRFIDYGRTVPPHLTGKVTEADVQAALVQAEAWMAVIGDRLARIYPDAEVFETKDAMLAKYPANPQYQEPPAVDPCQWCGTPVLVSERIMHAALCPQAKRF